MKVAALDLGTNTFLLLIADVAAGRIEQVLHDEVRIVRLGQGVHDSRRFHPDALIRAEECFAAFAQTIRKHNVSRVQACATSAARDVVNGSVLIELGRKYGIPIDIISGEREAELTFLGTIRAADTQGKSAENKPVAIIDVGGGSTEIIFGTNAGVSARTSMDVGSVRLTELCVTGHPISFADMEKMTGYISERIQTSLRALPRQSHDQIIAVAGTPTTLATLDQALPFESERVDGYVLSIERLRFWVDRLAGMKIEDRQKLAGMEPKRADVIVAGALVLLLTAEALGAKSLVVSVRGLRYGVARSLAHE